MALSQYAEHGPTILRELAVMAEKRESLGNLKQKRKSAHLKAEETAHQLNRMNADNKYYSMHAEALIRLRKDVRKMDDDIRLEETILIDHKQTATKVWMRLKFGGLYEFCEKCSVSILFYLPSPSLAHLFYLHLDRGQIWKIGHCS